MSNERQIYEGPENCHGEMLVQLAHSNGTLHKFRHWSIQDACDGLADYLKCLRTERNKHGERVWFIRKEGPRRFYCARIDSRPGHFHVASVCHRVPVIPIKSDALLGAVVAARVPS